jgi:phospholipid transport system substrate-binding protein
MQTANEAETCLPANPGRRAWLAAGFSLALLAMLPGVARTATTNPTTFIEQVGKDVVETLQDRQLSRTERFERLVTLLNEATDLELVARLVMGTHWRNASPEQRQEYQQLFRRLVVKTMADRLNAYGGETFEISGSETVDDRDTMVATKIERPSGQPPVRVQWRVRGNDGRFAIIDIVAEGVSMVVTQRSEVAEIVSTRGIEGLLVEMRERLDRPSSA